MKKILVIVGGNSNLSLNILESEDFLNCFEKIILITTGLIGKNKSFLRPNDFVAENSFDVGLDNILGRIIKENKISELTFIFSSTPTDLELYKSPSILIKSLEGVFTLKEAVKYPNRCKFFIMGSSLVFVPLLNKSPYKKIKRIELELYETIKKFTPNLRYIIVPPLYPAKSTLSNLFAMNRKTFVKQLLCCIENEGSQQSFEIVGSSFSKIFTSIFVFIFKIGQVLR